MRGGDFKLDKNCIFSPPVFDTLYCPQQRHAISYIGA